MNTTVTPDTTTPKPTPNARGPLPGGKWYVPVTDAAEILPLSLRYLRTLIEEEAIRYRRVGSRQFLMWPDDFEDFMESSTIDPAA